jgi:hypothetical protein
MTAAAWVFAVAAAVMFGFGPAFCLALWLAERRDLREDEQLRAVEDRRVDAEWFALLAATETTPIFDQLVCEQIEREEGWAS